MNELYRLRDHLTKIDLGESGFSIDKHVTSIALMAVEAVPVKGKSTLGLKAREHYGLKMGFCLLAIVKADFDSIFTNSETMAGASLENGALD